VGYLSEFLAGLKIVEWLRARIKGGRKASPGIYVSTYPRYGYKDIGWGQFLDAKWLLRLPQQSAFIIPSPSELAEDLEVLGPYCPACQTELRQSRWLLLWYRWCCGGCNFKKISKISAYKAKEECSPVFKAEVRKRAEKERGQ
jgi:hypothetical protein